MLKLFNVCYSGLSKWEDIERLSFFPKLEEVKVKGIPLLEPYTAHERHSLLLAQWVRTYTCIHIESLLSFRCTVACLFIYCLIFIRTPAYRLPSVVVLNGGAVFNGEREDAERFFIRYYQDCPEQELPQRYVDIRHSTFSDGWSVFSQVLHLDLTFFLVWTSTENS